MSVKQNIISILNKLPYVRGLYQENMNLKKNSCYPPGHYYSPIISVDEIKKKQDKIWSSESIDGIKGINLNADRQINLLQQLKKYYSELPFSENKT
ncbi:MAG: hypothetical protein NZ522_03220, partial [Chitinophagales bacterium]|nr:hypothetical protein [Chitinophagales bacterium]